MLLEIKDITIAYGANEAVKNVSFSVEKGEIVGIVGESGSGKSTLLRAIMGISSSEAQITKGEILLYGKDIVSEDKKALLQIQGKTLAAVFQYPEQSLDPLVKIQDTFYECVWLHNKRASKKETRRKMLELLKNMNIGDCERVADSYPFELSGGMCQRVTIGMAMMNDPALLLADEPTSALDVNSQLQVVDTLMEIRRSSNTSIILVTHNMGLVAKMADKVGVMLDGRMVEFGSREELLNKPMHSYTKALIGSVPKMDCSIPKAIGFSRSQNGIDEIAFCSKGHWFIKEQKTN